jgi:hypothetical protein
MMDTRFLRPKVIWAGVWIAILLLIFSIGYWQSNLYWKNTFERVQQREFKMLLDVSPYVLAFLEEHGQTDLIRQVLDPDKELFTLVYTDLSGAFKFTSPSASESRGDLTNINLKKHKFIYVYKSPQPRVDAGPSEEAAPDSQNVAPAYGKLYILGKAPPTLRETIQQEDFFHKIWPGESFLGFTIIGYLLLMTGFAAICSITARFQSHFQAALEDQHRSELETRDLRIQVLQFNLKTLDLRLQILDQNREKALTNSNKSKKALDRLVKKLQSESTKNEELEAKLGQAKLEHKNALKAIQAIKEDMEQVAAERQQLETLRQAEQQEPAGRDRPASVKPKEFLWLNLVYENLLFSKKALQNIGGIQFVHDVFPSLPHALSIINHTKVDALLSGEGIPSRSVVRYSQTPDNFKGYLWEYRFSKDGRIFFGLSQSRTWSIDTILLKRHFSLNRYKYEKYLEATLGKDNDDLKPGLSQ